MNKKELHKSLIQTKQELLANLEKAQKYYKDGADLEEGSTLDQEDYSHQGEWTESAMIMDRRIKDAKAALRDLENINVEPSERAESGALVRLKGASLWMFLGTSFPKTKWNEKAIIGVSPTAPIYNQLQGLKAGNSFEWKGKNQTIAEVI